MTLNDQTRKRISTRPYLFFLTKYLFKKHEYYYDQENFFFVDRDKNVTQTYPLSSITSIKKTGDKMNNRRFWRITLTHNGEKKNFKFLHNYTLWNKNFPDFLDYISKSYPRVERTEFTIWNR